MTTSQPQPYAMDSVLTHEKIATLLEECVLQERQHISSLDLEGMLEWTQRRRDLIQQVLLLAEVSEPDIATARIYKRVHFTARENYDLLQAAHALTQEILDGVLATSGGSTYGSSGRSGQGRQRNIMVWKG